MDGIEQSVHIIPLGHEFDRAVSVFANTRVDRVYLLTSHTKTPTSRGMKEEQHTFTDRVREHLEKKGIDVHIIDTNTFELLDVTKNIAKIVKREVQEGNRVSINMSAAGRLTSVASTLVGMMHGVRVYYVAADNYSRSDEDRNKHGISICTTGRPQYLMNIPLPRLDDEKNVILTSLCKMGRSMNSRDLREILRDQGFEGFEDFNEIQDRNKRRKVESRQLMKLSQSFLRPLEKEGYIRVEKRGRENRVYLTDSGQYLAMASGDID